MQFVHDSLAVNYHEHHIIIYGRSMGSGFACKLASDNKPRYLILMPLPQFQKSSRTFFTHTTGEVCTKISFTYR
jgi:esterase/lipase